MKVFVLSLIQDQVLQRQKLQNKQLVDENVYQVESMSNVRKQKGKLDEDDDVFFLDNSTIRGIGTDTLDIWSAVSEAGESVIINLAVNSSGTFSFGGL